VLGTLCSRPWLAGRTKESFVSAKERHPTLRSLRSNQFAAVDSSDPASLAAALAGADLVVHSAGPFQGGGDACAVLEAGPPQCTGARLVIHPQCVLVFASSFTT